MPAIMEIRIIFSIFAQLKSKREKWQKREELPVSRRLPKRSRLMNTDICKEYSFLEVYESIMFTFLRGISTEKGAHESEVFIRYYRKKTISGINESEID